VGSKVRVLVHDIGGCEGCPISVIRALPELVGIADVHSRYLGNEDVSGGVTYDVGIVTGAVCINEPDVVGKLRVIREVSKVLIAYGSCASVGGITRFCRGGQEPRPEHRTYQPVTAVVRVDYAVPGCPPAPTFIASLIKSIVKGGGYFLKLFSAVVKARKLSGFDLLDDVVLPGLCVGCGACILSCPTGALQMIDGKPDLVVEKCIRCGTCYVRCPRASQLLIRRYIQLGGVKG